MVPSQYRWIVILGVLGLLGGGLYWTTQTASEPEVIGVFVGEDGEVITMDETNALPDLRAQYQAGDDEIG